MLGRFRIDVMQFLRLYRAMSASVVEAFCCGNPLINATLHIACAPFVLELTPPRPEDGGHDRAGRRLKGRLRLAGGHRRGGHSRAGRGRGSVVGAAAICRQPRRPGRRACRVDVVAAARYASCSRNDFGILTGAAGTSGGMSSWSMPERPQSTIRASRCGICSAGGSLLLYPRGEIEADPALWTRRRRCETLAAVVTIAFTRLRAACARIWRSCRWRYRRRDFTAGAARIPWSRAAIAMCDERHFLAATFQMMFARSTAILLVSVHYGRAAAG